MRHWLCSALVGLLVACRSSEAPEPTVAAVQAAVQPDRPSPAPWTDVALAWHEWSAVALERAAVADLPVLLYVAAPGWDGVFAAASPALQQLVESAFVAVRVDPFVRPDVAGRYAPHGWPAVVVLLPDGRPYAHAVDLPARNAWSYLRRLLQAYGERREVLQAKVAAAAAAPDAACPVHPDLVYRACATAFDAVHGGFGAGMKLVEPVTLAFLLRYGAAAGDGAADSVALRMVEQTLTAIAAGPLLDRQFGGVHSVSFTPDWRTPGPEKDGADQALLLELLESPAGRRLTVGRELGEHLREYITGQLFDPAVGAFRGRQVRRADGAWWTDPRTYADRHALLTHAVASAARAHADPRLRTVALRAADHLARACIDTSGAVRHLCGDGGVEGLLADQALAGLALLRAGELEGPPHLATAAHRVAQYMRAQLESVSTPRAGGAGSQRRGTQDPGSLGLPGALPYANMVGGLPAAEALAAALLLRLEQPDQARRLLAAVRVPCPVSRAHSDLAWAMLGPGRVH